MPSLVDLVRGEGFLRVPVHTGCKTILVIGKEWAGKLESVKTYLEGFDAKSAIRQLNSKNFGTSKSITHVIYTGGNPDEWAVLVGGQEPYITLLKNCGFPFNGKRRQMYERKGEKTDYPEACASQPL